MKNILFAILQFILFFALFFGGSLFPLFHIQQVLSVTPEGTRIFIWDGVALMFLLLLVILFIESRRNRIRAAAPWTAAAFTLAAIAGYALKLGFLTR
ncbi:MAG TPA: hypothetical protein VGU46_09635 [Acidobacteriaceae bacterium]|nr:hypothetical protein [Acidobacteriaceae bacterium]